MSFWENVSGTVSDWFGFGGEPTVAIGRDGSGNLVFQDDIVSGTRTLTQLLEGGDIGHPFEIANGDTLTIDAGRQLDHIGRVKIDGRAEVDGRFTLGC